MNCCREAVQQFRFYVAELSLIKNTLSLLHFDFRDEEHHNALRVPSSSCVNALNIEEEAGFGLFAKALHFPVQTFSLFPV